MKGLRPNHIFDWPVLMAILSEFQVIIITGGNTQNLDSAASSDPGFHADGFPLPWITFAFGVNS